MQDRASFKTTPNFSCVSAAISVGMFNNFFFITMLLTHITNMCVFSICLNNSNNFFDKLPTAT